MKNSKVLISELLMQKHGVDVLRYDSAFFEKTLEKRISETQCGSRDAYCLFLKKNSLEAKQLIDSFTVSYSEFFRNQLTFAVLEKIVFPKLVMAKRTLRNKEIRIWSAACASGQETYSIAMLLQENLSNVHEGINYLIFATDSCPSQILQAQSGLYSEVALNNISLSRLSRWFTKQENLYAVNDILKKNIDFSVFDLFDTSFTCPPASIFGNFDIVFCANLLFYYSLEFRSDIIEKVNNSLSDNGLLITSETEREILIQAGFKEVYPRSAIFRKNY